MGELVSKWLAAGVNAGEAIGCIGELCEYMAGSGVNVGEAIG